MFIVRKQQASSVRDVKGRRSPVLAVRLKQISQDGKISGCLAIEHVMSKASSAEAKPQNCVCRCIIQRCIHRPAGIGGDAQATFTPPAPAYAYNQVPPPTHAYAGGPPHFQVGPCLFPVAFRAPVMLKSTRSGQLSSAGTVVIMVPCARVDDLLADHQSSCI